MTTAITTTVRGAVEPARLDLTVPVGDVLDQGNARLLIDLDVDGGRAAYAIAFLVDGLNELLGDLLGAERLGVPGADLDERTRDSLTELQKALAAS